jgi:flagellar basal body rod protein FlgF
MWRCAIRLAGRHPADGSEAYTRNGSLKVSDNGLLQTQSGLTLVGDGGPIAIPPDTNISIASDGTVSAISNDFKPGPANVLGRLKLVNPDTKGWCAATTACSARLVAKWRKTIRPCACRWCAGRQ